MSGKIWILGVGAFGSKCLPSGMTELMAGVEAVYTHIVEDPNEWLPQALVGATLISLSSCYSDSQSRVSNYLRAATTVVDGAAKPAEVVFYTYGSPTVFDRVVSLVREMSAVKHISCIVIPAASSVDATLAFLGEDMAPGLQICEARWLVCNKIPLDPRLPTLLFQVGSFWTDGLTSSNELQTSRLIPLRDYLLLHYPNFNPAIFVRAPFRLGDSGYARGLELRDLDKGVSDDLMGTSLFIPEALGVNRASKVWWKTLFETPTAGDRSPVIAH